jgi:hypothetical protein
MALRANRVRWQAVALLASSLASLVTCVVLFGVMRPPRPPGEPTDPHALPLDLANYYLRDALDEYAMFTLGRGLEPIADRCGDQLEIYRAVNVDPESVAVDLEVSSNAATATVTTRIFDEGAPGDYGWHIASRRVVGDQEIGAIRHAAVSLLLSRMPSAIGVEPLDASEWVVETCRNGHYHFFQRSNPTSTPLMNESFITFYRAMWALDTSLRH